MQTEDVVGILILGTYGSLMVLEGLVPARRYPGRSLWRLKGWGWLVLMAAIATVLPLLLPTGLTDHRLLDLRGVGTIGGAALGYAAVSLINYWWHRAAHRFGFLWRTFHQVHHAPHRLDLAGAAIFHPLEVSVYVILSTVTTTLVLGLSPEAAAVTGFVAQFYSFFQHMNVRTPAWLGYFIQRPEAHFVHHSRETHAWNYGDLPIWDILLGTFRNPRVFGEGEVGFAAPADRRVGAMLAFRDVSEAVGTKVQTVGVPAPQ